MPSAKASERGNSTTAGSSHRGSVGGIHNSILASGTTHKERLRAAVRGALGSHHRHEADLSDSTFLGNAADSPRKPFHPTPSIVVTAAADEEDDSSPESRGDSGTLLFDGPDDGHQNPVDEMYVF
jgi:hypothetical protein